MALPNPDDLWAKLDAGKGGFSDAEVEHMMDLLFDPTHGSNMTPEEFDNRLSQLYVESAGKDENILDDETTTPDYARDGSWWAPITHTSETTNPKKPRTIGAGYDVTRYILTVQFRDLTLYNYYDVPPHVWSQFRAASSKGQYMQRELDSWPEKGKVSGHSQEYYKGRGKRARAAQLNKYKPYGGKL